MKDTLGYKTSDMNGFENLPKKKKFSYLINLLLFIATFITSTIAGTQWAGYYPGEIGNWHHGLLYAILIMTFLAAHEMGHYIASRLHRVDASLPYFIPAPFQEMLFGTFGALIKTRNMFPTRKALFDIGAAGPIAGFIVCIIFLIIGFSTLPPKEFIYTIHPEYTLLGGDIPDTGLHFGNTIVFSFLADVFANPSGWLPPMNEIYHYPFLCVAWFGLFVTTLNMLPIGQLDGGHIVYAMYDKKQHKIAKYAWYIILIIGFGSLLSFSITFLENFDYPYSIYISLQDNLLPALIDFRNLAPWYFDGWGGWIFWALITRFFIKIPHPEIPLYDELDSKRILIGWITIIILLLSISYDGIYFK